MPSRYFASALEMAKRGDVDVHVFGTQNPFTVEDWWMTNPEEEMTDTSVPKDRIAQNGQAVVYLGILTPEQITLSIGEL